jgi:hypothetical protein
MLDRHLLSTVAKVAAAVLGIGLVVYHWNGISDVPGGNFFMNSALFMCVGLVLLADPLIDEVGLRALAKICGYVGIAGIAIATLC